MKWKKKRQTGSFNYFLYRENFGGATFTRGGQLLEVIWYTAQWSEGVTKPIWSYS